MVKHSHKTPFWLGSLSLPQSPFTSLQRQQRSRGAGSQQRSHALPDKPGSPP